MTRGRFWFWLLFAATLAVYLAMILWTLPGIARAAGGLPAFDLRPMGYSPDQARAFLSALAPDGLALYLGPQKWLDLAYPALLAAVLVLALWRLLPARWVLVRPMLAALPVIASGFDYLENLRIHALLLAGPTAATDAMIHAASAATMAKSALATAAFLVLLAALFGHALRRLLGRAR